MCLVQAGEEADMAFHKHGREMTQRTPLPSQGLCVLVLWRVIHIQTLICYTSQAERMLLNTFDVAIIVCVIFNHGCHQILLNLI